MRRFARISLVMFAFSALGGCESADISAYNACRGSWTKIVDGKEHVLIARLEFGHSATIPVEGVGGQSGSVVLRAEGFTNDGRNDPIGTVSATYYTGNGGALAPHQAPWDITYYSSTWDCQRGVQIK